MYEEEDRDLIPAKEVMEVTFELIQKLSATQSAWARQRLVTNGFLERLAVYAAYTAMAKAFDLRKIEGLPPETLKFMSDMIDGIELQTGQIPSEKVLA